MHTYILRQAVSPIGEIARFVDSFYFLPNKVDIKHLIFLQKQFDFTSKYLNRKYFLGGHI